MSTPGHFPTYHIPDDGTRYTPGDVVRVDRSSGRVRGQTPWSPRVGEYVRITATGEPGLVTEAAGHDGGRFLVRILPDAEGPSPRARIAASPLHVVHRLHELAPEPRPSSGGV